MISRETIDDVKNRIDIVDVISDFVSLKRSGQNYKALSPFNNEKTASFFVVPAKGIFKDFSSGKGGDAITFIMEHEGLSYLEAIRFLAKKYGVEIKEEASSIEAREQQSEREGLYILMNFAKEYYRHNLTETEEGRGIGLSYFRERGFNDRTIQKFELGYALEGWSHLMDEATEKNYNKELLEKAGLVVKNEEGRTYDRFRGRVMFPVHNLSGKVIAFGARMMGKEKNQPKYINSPETEIYHKSQVLYGLYQGKNAIRQHDNCYLVEGYTDVISMHQADVENVVASSGTALTEEQIKLIRRFTNNVTVLFDGDSAGIKAALRGIDLILKGGLNVRLVLLPDSEDPDSYSRKVGTAEFHKFINSNTRDFVSFKASLYAKEVENDPIRKAEVIQEILTSVSLVPDFLKRETYLQEVSGIFGITHSVLNSELNKKLIHDRRQKKAQVEVEESAMSFSDVHELSKSFIYDSLKELRLLEGEFIKVLIHTGGMQDSDGTFVWKHLFEETEDIDFVSAEARDILDLFKLEIAKGSVPDSQKIVSLVPREFQEYLSNLVVPKYTVSDGWKKHNIYVESEYGTKSWFVAVSRMKLSVIQKMLDDGKQKIRQEVDRTAMDVLIDTQAQIEEVKKVVAGSLGRVVLRGSTKAITEA